jgi:hypothetical protein
MSSSAASFDNSSSRGSTGPATECLVDDSGSNRSFRERISRQSSFSSERSGNDQFGEQERIDHHIQHGSSGGEENSSGDDDSYYHSDQQGMAVSSDESMNPPQGNSAERRHELAVQREEDRVLQRMLFHEDKGFKFNVDTASSVKRVLKEKIFPKIKILSGRENDYLTPDFVGDKADQSRLICEKIFQDLDLEDHLEDKIRFWITYRKLVKNQLVKYRSNCVEDLKREYFKGMDGVNL